MIKIIQMILTLLLGIILFGSIIYCALSGQKITEIFLHWELWITFLVADIWITQKSEKLFGKKD